MSTTHQPADGDYVSRRSFSISRADGTVVKIDGTERLRDIEITEDGDLVLVVTRGYGLARHVVRDGDVLLVQKGDESTARFASRAGVVVAFTEAVA